MGHLKQRKEKNCLNCNAIVSDKFCGICGQENTETKETLLNLINHFFKDITHFDGKFFSSLKLLIFKPGYLSTEYLRGRRQAYLNPIRFYVFTSFIFFIFFLSFAKNATNDSDDKEEIKSDSIQVNNKVTIIEKKLSEPIINIKYKKDLSNKNDGNNWIFSKYKTKSEYDSLIKLNKIDDSYIGKKVNYKFLELKEKYNSDSKKVGALIFEKGLKNLPILFLFSLPFLALFLKLIYFRRKQYFFVSHAIFIIHIYIFTFIAILVSLLFSNLADVFLYSVFNFLSLLLFILVFFYWYKAFRKFYNQSRVVTLLKLILSLFWGFLIMSFMIVFLLIFTVLTI